MAVALTTGTGQATNVPTQTPVMPDDGDYRLKTNGPNESLYVNTAGTLDQPNAVRHSVQEVADVFKSSGVKPDSGQGTEGLSLLTQVTETWKVADAADATVDPYYLPASAHLVVKVPKDVMVTPTIVAGLILRLFGALWADSTDTLSEAVEPVLHGVTALR